MKEGTSDLLLFLTLGIVALIAIVAVAGFAADYELGDSKALAPNVRGTWEVPLWGCRATDSCEVTSATARTATVLADAPTSAVHVSVCNGEAAVRWAALADPTLSWGHYLAANGSVEMSARLWRQTRWISTGTTSTMAVTFRGRE